MTLTDVRLNHEVFLPPGRGPWPAALLRTPYGIADQRDEARRRAKDGVAVVVQDVRGRFGSGGVFDLGASDRDDGAAAIAWVAEQSFCDGRVAGYGVSYCGFTQWHAATARPQALTSIAPLMAPTWWRGLGFRTGGAVELAAAAHWMPRQAATAPGVSAEGANTAFARAFEVNQVIPDGTDRVLEDRALAHTALVRDRLAEPWPVEMDATFAALWEQLWRQPPPPPWSLDPGPADDVGVPALVLTGWYDPWCSDAIAAFTHLSDDRSRLIVAPSGHGYDPVRSWALPPAALQFGLDVDHEWAREWFGRPGRLRNLAPVTYWMIGDDDFRAAPSWPPPDAAPRTEHLLAGGDVSYVHDPARPVPSRGGSGMILAPGPVDQAGLTGGAHPGVVSFDLDIAVRPIELAGPVHATITFSSSAVDADVVVKLVDVAPDGAAALIADGVCRTRWRHGGVAPVWLEPGRREPIDVWLGHVAYRVGAGHRLRVDVTSSNFPRWDVNPGTKVDEGRGGPTDCVVAHQNVHAPSTITFHALENACD